MGCQIRKLKWPDAHHHRADAVVLGDDEHGTWLFSRRGSAAMDRDGKAAAVARDVLSLVPKGGAWWVAMWIFETSGALEKLWVDIATPVRWINGDAEYVDLQIDIQRLDGCEAELLDVEEFEQRVLTAPYPASVAAAARAAAAFVIEGARSHANPFGDAYEIWKARAGI